MGGGLPGRFTGRRRAARFAALAAWLGVAGGALAMVVAAVAADEQEGGEQAGDGEGTQHKNLLGLRLAPY